MTRIIVTTHGLFTPFYTSHVFRWRGRFAKGRGIFLETRHDAQRRLREETKLPIFHRLPSDPPFTKAF